MMRSLGLVDRVGATIPFILGEVTEDERARWMRIMVVLGLAGIITIFSPDLLNAITGIDIFDSTAPTGFPSTTWSALQNLFTIMRVLGVAMVVIGGVFSVIKL